MRVWNDGSGGGAGENRPRILRRAGTPTPLEEGERDPHFVTNGPRRVARTAEESRDSSRRRLRSE